MAKLTANGTQTSVINTEHILSTLTNNRFYMAYVDLTNMALNDTVEIKISIMIKSGGSHITYYKQIFEDVQTDPLIFIPTLPSDISYRLSIKQTEGSPRTFDWRILEV